MATKEECRAALAELVRRLDDVDDGLKRRHAVDRIIACHLPDLDTTYSGRLRNGSIQAIVDGPLPGAQIRVTVSSDDLLAVTTGALPIGTAWATGRLRVEASVLDMLRLRAMI